jgi:hypothetical protein
MGEDFGHFNRLVDPVDAGYVARAENYGRAFEQSADQAPVRS